MKYQNLADSIALAMKETMVSPVDAVDELIDELSDATAGLRGKLHDEVSDGSISSVTLERQAEITRFIEALRRSGRRLDRLASREGRELG